MQRDDTMMTKFLRCNEYRPVFSDAVLEAIGHYHQIHALRTEANKAIRIAGLSVSANMLQIKLAKLVEAAELTGKQELLLTDLSEKLYDIKRRFQDPSEQKQAISKLIFEGNYWSFIMEQLYGYLPKLEKMLIGGMNGMAPVSRSDAEEIASTALQNFVQNKEKASIVSSLERFDPSEGSLLNWMQGGVKAATQKLVAERQQLQKQELSINQKVGDNDDTEMGDMLSGDSGEPDLSTYAERADKLITTLANYARSLQQKIERSESGGEKFKLQSLLQHIQNPENEVSAKLQRLKQIGDDIDDYDYDVTQAEADITDLMNAVARANPDPNTLEGAKARRNVLLQKLQKAKEIRQNAINEFEGIYSNLRDLEQYNVETGATIVNNAPTQEPVAPGAIAPDAIAPDMPAPDMQGAVSTPITEAPMSPEVQVRTKARGGRSLLSPQDEKLITDRLEQSRNKLRPSIYEAMEYPKSVKGMHDPTAANLFNLKIVKDNIKNKADLEAVVSGNLENASEDAIYADICVRGMLYARDQQAMEKAFDPEIIQSDAEILRGATSKFYQFVLNEIQNNPVLVERQAKYTAATGNLQDGSNGQDPESPQGKLIAKLEEYINPKNSSFRTWFEHFDHMARGSAYQKAKKELFPDVPWENLTPENKQQIVEAVYEDQYTGGYRPMYIAKHKNDGESNKYEPRYPLQHDLTGEKYRGIMGRELDRIGLQRSKQPGTYLHPDYQRDDWYEISPNEADFKNRPKLKQKPQLGDDSIETASALDAWVKIANAYDMIGQYVMADRITDKIKRMAHG